MKATEAKLESDKRRLKEVLDASESRSIKLELQRRALEGELQRSRLGLGDREAHAQALQDRVDSLQRQVGHSPPSHTHTPCSWLCSQLYEASLFTLRFQRWTGRVSEWSCPYPSLSQVDGPLDRVIAPQWGEARLSWEFLSVDEAQREVRGAWASTPGGDHSGKKALDRPSPLLTGGRQ